MSRFSDTVFSPAQIKGISCYGKANVDLDADVRVELLKRSQKIKEELRGMAGEIAIAVMKELEEVQRHLRVCRSLHLSLICI